MTSSGPKQASMAAPGDATEAFVALAEAASMRNGELVTAATS